MSGDKLPWMVLALSKLGLQEVRGPADNPEILEMAEAIGCDDYLHDSQSWCSLFPAWALKMALPEEPLPKYPLWSRGYVRWGRALPSPVFGSLCVQWRGRSMEQDLGHLGFYVGGDRILGGNQSDSVSIITLDRSRLLATRWPLTYPLPEA